MSRTDDLYKALRSAGLTVRQHAGWESRGGSWSAGKPLGVMEHHTALPVPFPVDRLAGSLLKCNMNTKPDGTVWLVAYGACNYSSGSGSRVVLDEVRAGDEPDDNARERGLRDDTNGNPYFWNFENDHRGDGSSIPAVQLDAIVTSTAVVCEHFALAGEQVISHAEWTARKRDPYWNEDMRAIEQIRSAVKEATVLTDRDLDRIWRYLIPDMDDGTGERGTAHAVKQAWKFSIDAARASAEAVRLIRELARQGPGGGGISDADIARIRSEVEAEIREQLESAELKVTF